MYILNYAAYYYGAPRDPQIRMTVGGEHHYYTQAVAAFNDVGEITECAPVSEAERSTAVQEVLDACDPNLLSKATTLCTNAIDSYIVDTWLGQCQVEICLSGDAMAVTISQSYNTSGDPMDDCSSDTKAYATNKCYTELSQNCEATKEWVDVCVADVCAAEKAGNPTPLEIADGYCGPQNDLKEILDQLDQNNDLFPVVDGSLPPTTRTTTVGDPAKMWDLCGGPEMGPYVSQIPCAIPVTIEQCQNACESKQDPFSGYYSCDPGDVVRPRNTTGKPPGCFFYTKFGVRWLGYNHHVYNPIENEGVFNDVLAESRVCCGNLAMLATSTTSTPGWLGVLEGEQDKAPLQPLPASTLPVTIDRPADAKVGVCSMWADPHFWVFDRGPMFNFYGAGTYWIVQSGPVWIQGYYAAATLKRPILTSLMKVAVGGPFLQGNTMMIETKKMWWNGDDNIIPASPNGVTQWTEMSGEVNAKIQQSYGAWKWINVNFPGDISIQVSKVTYQGQIYVNVRVVMRQITGQDGQCGNFNLDKSDDTPSLLKQRFGERVESSMKLIPY